MMRLRKYQTWLVALCVILAAVTVANAKGGSSSSRSSGSTSRPSTSRPSTSRPSTTSRPSHSYSTGSSSKSSGSASKSHSYSTGSGSSKYTTGGTTKSNATKSSTPSTSRPSSTAPKSRSYTTGSPPSSKYTTGSSSKYTTGDAKPSTKSYSPKATTAPSPKATTSRPKAAPKYGSDAAASQRRQESAAAFKADQVKSQPKTQPKASATASYKETIKSSYDPAKYATRNSRRQQFQTVHHHYHDSPSWGRLSSGSSIFDTMFLMWLLNEASSSNRADWIYHHRQQLDDRTYRELVQDNADVKARLAALERDGVKQDPAYAPPGIDNDLQYKDDVYNAAVTKTVTPDRVASSQPVQTKSSSHWFLWTVGLVVVVILFVRFVPVIKG